MNLTKEQRDEIRANCVKDCTAASHADSKLMIDALDDITDLEKQIAHQQAVIEKLKNRLNDERIMRDDSMCERDELKRYKNILDTALAAAEELKGE